MKFNKKYQALVALVGVTAVAGAFAAQSVTPSATSTKNFSNKKRGGMHKEITDVEKEKHQDELATSLASALGVTKESVLASLASGKTPQDIIKASGLDEKTVEAKLQASHLTELKAKLATDVTAGKLTQAEANTKLAEMGNHMNKKENKNFKDGFMKKGMHSRGATTTNATTTH